MAQVNKRKAFYFLMWLKIGIWCWFWGWMFRLVHPTHTVKTESVVFWVVVVVVLVVVVVVAQLQDACSHHFRTYRRHLNTSWKVVFFFRGPNTSSTGIWIFKVGLVVYSQSWSFLLRKLHGTKIKRIKFRHGWNWWGCFGTIWWTHWNAIYIYCI